VNLDMLELAVNCRNISSYCCQLEV